MPARMNKLINTLRKSIFHEQRYPRYLAILCCFIVCCLINKYGIEYSNEFEKVIDSVITFSSILLGFVGVLLGLLFSISNDTNVRRLLENHIASEILKDYFYSALLTGLLVVVLSIILYLEPSISEIISYQYGDSKLTFYGLLVALWCGLIVSNVTGTFRIVRVIMHIVFDPQRDSDLKNDNYPLTISESESEQLREKFKKK